MTTSESRPTVPFLVCPERVPRDGDCLEEVRPVKGRACQSGVGDAATGIQTQRIQPALLNSFSGVTGAAPQTIKGKGIDGRTRSLVNWFDLTRLTALAS